MLETQVQILPCGHGEWFDAHCAVMDCERYINLCDVHCRDDETATCSLTTALPTDQGSL